MPNINPATELEFSPLSRGYTRDGITVVIEIFRAKGGSGGWFLEVAVSDNDHIGWDEPFATDQEAYDEVMEIIEERGMREFTTPPTEWVHPTLN